MALQNPLLKKPKDPLADGAATTLPTVTVRPTFAQKLAAGPRAFGGLPNTPDKGSPMARADAAALSNKTNVLGIPVSAGIGGGTGGPAAPATPSLPLGTRIGSALRQTRDQLGPVAASELNTLGGAAQGTINQLTAPLRYGAGLGEDVRRAYNGQPARADAGSSAPGITVPQVPNSFLDRPVAAAPAAVARGTAAQAPGVFIPEAGTSAARGSVAGIQALEGVAPSVRPFLQPLLQRLGGAARAGAGGAAAAASPAAAAPAAQAAPAGAAGVDVTGADGQTRHLNYGAVVDGVPTFSDGTGGIARTVSPEALQQLGQERSISRADVGAAGNVLASDVPGAPTSTAGRVAQLVRNANVPITGSRPTAQQFADADRLAIASRDPRSAAGIAARNLTIDAQYGSPRLRRMAEQALQQLAAGTDAGGLSAQQAQENQAALGTQGQNALAETDARGRNALQAIQLQGQNQLADTALTARLRAPTPGQLVQAADGSYTLVNPRTAAATPVLQGGKPLRGQPKNPPAPIYTSAGGAQTLEALTNSLLGVNPITGMVEDPNAPNGQRVPTGQERFAAMQQAAGQLRALGAQGGATAPADEADFLAKAKAAGSTASDAELRAYYAKTYGSAR